MAIRKFGIQEAILTTEDADDDLIRKEAARAWTPEDAAQLAQENSDSSFGDSDRS
jgi:hypothetical protein